MSKKTDVITKVVNKTDVKVEEKTEQPRVDIELKGTYERVSYPPVEKLEELTKVGFVCERFACDDLSQPLYRLAVENNRGNIEDLPKGLTPWMSAQDLSIALTGVMYLQPLLWKIVKEYQADAPKPEN